MLESKRKAIIFMLLSLFLAILAGGMVAGGAGLWLVSKTVKGIANGSIKKGFKKVGKKIGSMFNSIKGAFS